MKLLYAALGGAVGTVLRYLFTALVSRMADGMFPWGTLAVNLSGSFAVGFLWEVLMRFNASSDSRTFILIGIVGGFTTFSTFMLETVNLFRDSESGFALLNLMISNISGIILVIAGFFSARLTLNFLHRGGPL
jgi:CrcB protein